MQGPGKRILILYYSYSHQTMSLLKKMVIGLEENVLEIRMERLIPEQSLTFPVGSISGTVWMMLKTFFRKRLPIKSLNPMVFSSWDLIIVAGPTWSFNPSGVVLSMLDRDGRKLFRDQDVLPLISCRGYWRFHFWGLRSMLKKYSARTVCSPIVFTHPCPEPWSTIGVFLKLSGKIPESGRGWLRRYYPKYGHSNEQIAMARELGSKLGMDISNGKSASEIQFETPVAIHS